MRKERKTPMYADHYTMLNERTNQTPLNNTYLSLLNQAGLNRPSYDSFDDYVKAHPEGEDFRRWLTEDDKLKLVIIPAHPNWCGLPGDYNWAYIGKEYGRVGEEKKYQELGTFYVHVNDCDDSGANRRGLTWEQALQEVENLKLMAPFTIRELDEFGYETY